MFSATAKERQLLRRWRGYSEKHEAGYQVFKKLVEPLARDQQGNQEEVPVDVFSNRTRMLPMARHSSGWWKVAASVAILVAVSSLLYQYGFLGKGNPVELMTDAGHRLEAILPDGSHVWLNNSSKLTYRQQFGRVRAVELEGEAYFTVHKDATSPFIVDVDGLNIRATGTQFNVRSYFDEPTVETTLVEGGVKLKTQAGIKAKLGPGETLGFVKRTGRLVRREVEFSDNTGWKDGILVFNDASFMALMTRLERWYGVRIVFDAEVFQNIHYSGSIRNLRIDQVFDFINLTIPIEVEMNENYILLTKMDEKLKK